MQYRPLLALCAFALSSSAWAAGTISDGTAKFVRDEFAWNSGALSDFSGVSEPLTTDHLTSAGWAYRVAGDTRETFLPEPNASVYGVSASEHSWDDVDNRGLFRALESTFIIGPTSDEPSGRVVMQLTISNLSAVDPLTFDLFHMIDMEVGGGSTNSGELLTDVTFPSMKFTSPQGDLGYYLGDDADGWTAKPFDQVRAMLSDGDVDNLDDAGLPASDIDLTAGVQWSNRTLLPGETETYVASFSINTPVLMPDLSITMSASVDPVPEETTVDYIATIINSIDVPVPNAKVTFSPLPPGVSAVMTAGCDNDPLGYPECQLGSLALGEVHGVLLRVLPGKASPPQYKLQATISSDDADDYAPQNNTAELVTNVLVAARADMRLDKFNDVGGVSADIDGWAWTLALSNTSTATAAATFQPGDVLLIDQLPSQDVIYGTPTVGFPGDENDPDVDGNATCDIVGFDLTCTATSVMTFNPATRIEVRVPVLPQALQMYANPRAGGQCMADPGNVIDEQDESNNTCSDAVLAVDFMIFGDGFEG